MDKDDGRGLREWRKHIAWASVHGYAGTHLWPPPQYDKWGRHGVYTMKDDKGHWIGEERKREREREREMGDEGGGGPQRPQHGSEPSSSTGPASARPLPSWTRPVVVGRPSGRRGPARSWPRPSGRPLAGHWRRRSGRAGRGARESAGAAGPGRPAGGCSLVTHRSRRTAAAVAAAAVVVDAAVAVAAGGARWEIR